MPKFRKKPIVIEAVQHRNGMIPGEDFIFQAQKDGVIRFVVEDGTVLIKTLEGTMTANPGDYIIKGIKGEIYPCKPDIFEASYDLVQD